jgi:hypothetical protein
MCSLQLLLSLNIHRTHVFLVHNKDEENIGPKTEEQEKITFTTVSFSFMFSTSHHYLLIF